MGPWKVERGGLQFGMMTMGEEPSQKALIRRVKGSGKQRSSPERPTTPVIQHHGLCNLQRIPKELKIINHTDVLGTLTLS